MLNMSTRQYDDRLFEIFGMQKYRSKYPAVLACEDNYGQLLAEIALEIGLKPGTLVASGPMDVTACALGTGAIKNGQACTILGTAAIHEIVMDIPDIRPKMVGMTLCHADKNKWIRMLAAMTATPNIDWFLKEFSGALKEKDKDLLETVDSILGKIPPGSDGLMYHPYIFPGGERAPFVNPYASASFTGISVQHTAGHMLRALYEGVGFAMMDCYENMPIEPECINLSGGGAKSNAWCQIISDMMGKFIQIPEGSEFGAKGAALNAGVACGIYKNFDDAISRTVRYRRQYKPNLSNTKFYKELYELYKLTRIKLSETWEMRNIIYEKHKQFKKI